MPDDPQRRGTRRNGTNPRALGTNERATARNKWALRNWKRKAAKPHRPAVGIEKGGPTMHSSNKDERYWIAINGSSCAMSSMPMCNPLLTPTPEQMLGFPTHEEAKRAQRICLEAPMKEVRKFLAGLAPDVEIGRIRVIQPKHPQPPTADQSIWTESPEAHQAVQHAHIKTTGRAD